MSPMGNLHTPHDLSAQLSLTSNTWCGLYLQDVTKDSLDKNEQSAYWYHRYSLRPLLDPQGHVALTPTGGALYDVPLLLSEAQETILMTGKYLNAIRECGRPVERSLPAVVHIGECLKPDHMQDL